MFNPLKITFDENKLYQTVDNCSKNSFQTKPHFHPGWPSELFCCVAQLCVLRVKTDSKKRVTNTYSYRFGYLFQARQSAMEISLPPAPVKHLPLKLNPRKRRLGRQKMKTIMKHRVRHWSNDSWMIMLNMYLVCVLWKFGVLANCLRFYLH